MLLGWNGLGGTQRQALRLSANLRSLGVNPVVLTMRHADLSRNETIDGIDVHRVGCFPTGRLRPLAFLGGSLLWMLRHRHVFQVIHAHNLPAALTAALLRPLLRKPVVVKLPNAVGVEQFSRRRFGVLRWLILRRYITRFAALNAEIEQRLTDKGIPAQRIVRIPNGVESSNGHPSRDTAAMRRALGLEPDARVVIYLGRLIPEKGIAWLLEVWREVVREEPTSHLLIVGDGPDGERLRALADSLGLAEAVAFLGYQKAVDPLLAVAEILVLPSRSEGMSNALLEGMAHGLAVVATDVPGNRAVIEHAKDGLLVAYEDSRMLKEVLLRLVRDATLRMRLGREAAAKSASAFSIQAVANTYCGIYRDVVAERAPRRARTHPGPQTTSASNT